LLVVSLDFVDWVAKGLAGALNTALNAALNAFLICFALLDLF
jgi:hypothetical protein